MGKWLLLGVAALAATLSFPELACAQAGGGFAPTHGPGLYFSIPKLALALIVFWLFVKTTEWANIDAQTIGLDHNKWTLILIGGFLGGLALGLLIPGPWWLFYVVNFPLIVAGYAVPVTMYVKTRNTYVTIDEQVMTKDHIRFVLATKTKLGIEKEKKAPHEMGAPVVFHAQGAKTEQENQANVIVARQSPGYVTGKDLVADALDRRAEKVMLDYTAEKTHVRYQIDGVWHQINERDRESGDMMLAALKKMAALNEKERRAKQEGKIRADYKEKKYEVRFASQGVKTGERAVLHLIDPKAPKLKTLEELGMREKMQAQLKKALAGEKGMVLFCAPPAGGLSTSLRVSLSSTDRVLRDFQGLEEKSRREVEVENIDVMTFDASAGETPIPFLDRVVRREPDAMVVPELFDADTVAFLCKQANGSKLVVSTVRAKEAVEALLRVLALKPPADEFAQAVTAVLNTRLIRKLCKKCKEKYEPSPQLLQRLGIPQGRVTELWQERQPPGPEATEKEKKEKEKPCEVCGGIGYRGRTAIFELLLVDDALRQTLIQQPRLEALRQVARAGGHRGLQEEGVLLVAQGVTSLVELQRALKE